MNTDSYSDNFQKEETDNRQKQAKFREGVKAVIGGILIQMFNGSFFLWPTLSIYVISYLQQFNDGIDENAHFRGNLILVITNCLGYQVGPYLANVRKWDPKKILALGSFVAISGVIISSFMTNFWLFVLFYGAMSGIGCGTGYIVPLLCCWDHFPNKKGMMTGIIAGSYGIGSLVFTQVATRCVNPLGLTPNKDIGVKDYKLFDGQVANNVPKMLRTLACIYAVQCFIGICLISRPREEKEQSNIEKNNDTTEFESTSDSSQSSFKKYDPRTKQILREYDLVSVFACLHSRRFWEYFSFFLFSDLFCVLFVGSYKSLALAHGYPDHLLTIAASASAISQTLGRFISSSLYDVYGIKPVFLIMMIVNFIMAVSVYETLKYPLVYLAFVQVNFYLLGGIFSLFPTPISKSFGPKFGAQVYTLALLGGLCSSLIITVMMQFLAKPLGVRGLFNIGASFSLITIVQIVNFDERIDIERLDAKGLIIWGKPIEKRTLNETDDDFERVDIELVSSGPSRRESAELEVVSDISHDPRSKIFYNKTLLQYESLTNHKSKERDDVFDDTESQCTQQTRCTDGNANSGSRRRERTTSSRSLFGNGSGERLLEGKRSRNGFKESKFGKNAEETPESSDWSSEDSESEETGEKQNKAINDYFSLIKQ